jgi:Na+/melibiose symporter-like transporter
MDNIKRVEEQENTQSMEQTKVGYKDIFRQKEFFKYIVANVINRFGDSVDSVAFSWMIYLITQSAAWSAIIFGINRIPSVFLQPIAGAIVEDMSKKRVMIITDIIRGLCVAFVAILYMMNLLNPYLLIGLTIVISSAEAFRNPASTALLPKILEVKYYAYGMSLNSSMSTVVELIGLGIAGAIIAIGGIPAAISIDAITFFISAGIIAVICTKETKAHLNKMNITTSLNNLKEGFLYVRNNKIIMNFILITFLANGLLVPFNSLQAPLISQIYKQGEIMLSTIGITFSVGMLVGSFLYPIISQRISNKILMTMGGIIFGCYTMGLILIGPLRNIEFALFSMVSIMSIVAGVGIAFMISVLNIGFVKNVEEEYMARAGAILGAAAVAAIPIMSFLVSILVKITSVEIIFISTGIVTILIFFTFTFNKKLVV